MDNDYNIFCWQWFFMPIGKDVMFVIKQTFKEQINYIREEAIKIGFSKSTMDGYQIIWNKFILWKNEDNFCYDENDYIKFLFKHYDFDVNTYTNKSKSRHQQLMRSKRFLDDTDTYMKFISKRLVVNNKKDELEDNFVNIVNDYKNYLVTIKYNKSNTVELKGKYISNLLVYFQNIGLTDIKNLNKDFILSFINDSVEKGNRSKSRYFWILRDFLLFLYDIDIVNINLAYLIPTLRQSRNKRIPTYVKEDKISEVLNSFPKERKIDKRNYAIILTAAELGMRISDILNLKFENIDWIKKEIHFNQVKTNGYVTLSLSNELGWAIIDYIQNGRPTTECKNIFVKHSYPYEKMNKFNGYGKYFEKEYSEDITKKGIHDLRRSLATRLLNNEVPITIISEILGHSSPETTKIYLKVDIQKLKKCCLEVNKNV